MSKEAISENLQEISEYLSMGFTYRHLAKKYDCTEKYLRELVSKNKKLTNVYNLDHVEQKYRINKEFYETIQPSSVLDVCCGRSRFWASNYGNECKVISNDNMVDPNSVPDFKMTIDADKLLQAYSLADKHFDIVDVDLYGSPKDCLETAINIADKGLVVTFGDFKINRRFSSNTNNLFKKYYGIVVSSGEKITIEHLAKHVVKLSGNKLKVWEICDWRNCDRIYFIKEG